MTIQKCSEWIFLLLVRLLKCAHKPAIWAECKIQQWKETLVFSVLHNSDMSQSRTTKVLSELSMTQNRWHWWLKPDLNGTCSSSCNIDATRKSWIHLMKITWVIKCWIMKWSIKHEITLKILIYLLNISLVESNGVNCLMQHSIMLAKTSFICVIYCNYTVSVPFGSKNMS